MPATSSTIISQRISLCKYNEYTRKGRVVVVIKVYGTAEALHLENTIGSIAPGYEADMAVIDLAPSEFASWRLQFSDDIWQKLFVLMTLGLDNTNRATYVAGKKVYDRKREQPFEYDDQIK
ncbi:MAG: amidohydrolase family protein [Bacteroides sp.]|nr:amidohydrolase family protein [Bacteroides sp.]